MAQQNLLLMGAPAISPEERTLARQVFADFQRRRQALLVVLTEKKTDLRKACRRWKTKKRPPAALWAGADGRVCLRAKVELSEVYSPMPSFGIETALGDLMTREWLHLVAYYSDTWLLYLVFHATLSAGRLVTSTLLSEVLIRIFALPTLLDAVLADVCDDDWEIRPPPILEKMDTSNETPQERAKRFELRKSIRSLVSNVDNASASTSAAENGAQIPLYIAETPTAVIVTEDFKARHLMIYSALARSNFPSLSAFLGNPDGDICLYGFPDTAYCMKPPKAMQNRDNVPVPVVGVNMTLRSMGNLNWLKHLAGCSDAWLLAVAYQYSLKLGATSQELVEIFQIILERTTLLRHVLLEW